AARPGAERGGHAAGPGTDHHGPGRAVRVVRAARPAAAGLPAAGPAGPGRRLDVLRHGAAGPQPGRARPADEHGGAAARAAVRPAAAGGAGPGLAALDRPVQPVLLGDQRHPRAVRRARRRPGGVAEPAPAGHADRVVPVLGDAAVRRAGALTALTPP